MFKILILSLLSFFIYPILTFAHGSGLPPFFMINGKLSPVYPASQSGINLNSNLPQDIGPENYLINQPIEFEINSTNLLVTLTQDILNNMTFVWDFGDKTNGSGLKNIHMYTNTGSYLLTIIANYNKPNIPPQLIESVIINILPNFDYQLPNAVIRVNGYKVNDLLKEQLSLDLNNKLTFDANLSTAPSSKIVSYTWDFDDSVRSIHPITIHRYRLPQYFIYPSLRIVDANGFISDATVGIKNSGLNEPNNIDPTLEENINGSNNYIIIISILVVVSILVFIIKRKKIFIK